MKVSSVLSLGYFCQNSMFRFTLNFAQPILHFVFISWVCTRDSIFLHYIFNFDLCNIPLFAFDIQRFQKQQSSFWIRPSSSVECTFIFSHPTFSICPLSFRFRDFGHCTWKFSHSKFKFSKWTFTRCQRPMDIVGSINLTQSRSNCGRESVERLPSGVNSGDLIHSRQTRRRQQIEHGRSPGWRCTIFEGGGCCPTDCLL